MFRSKKLTFEWKWKPEFVHFLKKILVSPFSKISFCFTWEQFLFAPDFERNEQLSEKDRDKDSHDNDVNDNDDDDNDDNENDDDDNDDNDNNSNDSDGMTTTTIMMTVMTAAKMPTATTTRLVTTAAIVVAVTVQWRQLWELQQHQE